MENLTRARPQQRRAASDRGRREPRAVGRANAVAAVEHRPDRQLREQLCAAALVIGLGMRDDEQVDPPRALATDERRDVVARRAGVDQHRAAARLDQRRVALTDVEERDPERRRWAASVHRAGRASG